MKIMSVAVVMMVVGFAGCSVPPEPVDDDGPEQVDQVEQADTGCQLDCPGNPSITCGQPCSVSGGTITCSGVPQSCPVGCDPACSGGYQCVDQQCFRICGGGQSDCCGDGVCRGAILCARLGC